MQIFPAIDLKDKKVVRLTHGDYDKMDVYSDNPVEIAKKFNDEGSKNLHVVDLDGAKDGTQANFDVISKIAKVESLFIQVGGGIRDETVIKKYLNAGVNRVILGTAALEKPTFVKEMVEKYGESIAVGVDARDGKVAIKGWLETTNTDSMDFCLQLKNFGVSTIIYTDISKDGAMTGPNFDAYRTLQSSFGQSNFNIIASGGVSRINDIIELKNIGVHGVIVGKALYTNAMTLEQIFNFSQD